MCAPTRGNSDFLCLVHYYPYCTIGADNQDRRMVSPSLHQSSFRVTLQVVAYVHQVRSHSRPPAACPPSSANPYLLVVYFGSWCRWIARPTPPPLGTLQRQLPMQKPSLLQPRPHLNHHPTGNKTMELPAALDRFGSPRRGDHRSLKPKPRSRANAPGIASRSKPCATNATPISTLWSASWKRAGALLPRMRPWSRTSCGPASSSVSTMMSFGGRTKRC